MGLPRLDAINGPIFCGDRGQEGCLLGTVFSTVKREKPRSTRLFFYLVPRAGLEPARPNGHMALNHACLPISAPGQCIKKGANDTLFVVTPLGLEPRTLSLKVRCSNQLS